MLISFDSSFKEFTTLNDSSIIYSNKKFDFFNLNYSIFYNITLSFWFLFKVFQNFVSVLTFWRKSSALSLTALGLFLKFALKKLGYLLNFIVKNFGF